MVRLQHILYVDDIVVIGNDIEEGKALQSYFSREFEMKDLGARKKKKKNLGSLKYFLWIEVFRSSIGNFWSQRKYVLNLLLARDWNIKMSTRQYTNRRCENCELNLIKYLGIRCINAPNL